MTLSLLFEHALDSTVDALSLLPDGRLLVSARYRSPHAVDLATFAIERLGPEAHQPIAALRALAPGAPAPFLGFDNPDLVFWDAEGFNVEQRKTSLRMGSIPSTPVALHPSGLVLAYGDHKGVVTVHDVLKNKNTTLKGLTTRVSCVRFDADGKRLAAIGVREGAVWDLKTRKPTPITIDPPATLSTTVDFTADGAHLVANTHSWNGDPNVPGSYDLGIFSLASLSWTRSVHPERTVAALRVLDEGHIAACSGVGLSRHFVEVVRLEDGASAGLHEVAAFQRDFLPLGAGRFAVGGDDKTVRVFQFTP